MSEELNGGNWPHIVSFLSVGVNERRRGGKWCGYSSKRMGREERGGERLERGWRVPEPQTQTTKLRRLGWSLGSWRDTLKIIGHEVTSGSTVGGKLSLRLPQLRMGEVHRNSLSISHQAINLRKRNIPQASDLEESKILQGVLDQVFTFQKTWRTNEGGERKVKIDDNWFSWHLHSVTCWQRKFKHLELKIEVDVKERRRHEDELIIFWSYSQGIGCCYSQEFHERYQGCD
jgi:hypothetical protein